MLHNHLKWHVRALSQSSSTSSDALAPRSKARPVSSSTQAASPMLELSASEEVDVLSIDVDDIEEPPLHSLKYEELVDVVTLAVAKRNISWPHERQEVQKNEIPHSCLLACSETTKREYCL